MNLSALSIPGLFVTGTDTGVGKTVVAGAIANWFKRRQKKVAVCKIAATGCEMRREGLVSEDAEFLAVCADARHPLDLIAPQRYSEPLAPAIAAERAKRPIDWFLINNSIRLMSRGSDLMIVEGVGGVMVPLDEEHTVLDWMVALDAPAIVVAGTYLGTISHTLTALDALKRADVKIAALVLNDSGDGAVPISETRATLARFAPRTPIAEIPRVKSYVGARADFAKLAALL